MFLLWFWKFLWHLSAMCAALSCYAVCQNLLCSWFVFVLAYLGVVSAPLKMVPDNLHLRNYQLLLPVSSSFWACVNMTNGDAEVSPWDKHYTTERTHICYGQQPHSCSSPSTIDFRHEDNREIAKTVTLCLYKYIPSAYFSHVSIFCIDKGIMTQNGSS